MNQTGQVQVFDFEITEVRKYIVQGSGNNPFEAEQDAIERFHRVGKTGELAPFSISKPRVDKRTKVR